MSGEKRFSGNSPAVSRERQPAGLASIRRIGVIATVTAAASWHRPALRS